MTDDVSSDVATTDQGPGSGSLGGVARGSVVNLIGSAVSGLTTFALTIVVARSLTRSDTGVFFSATSLFILANVLGQLGTSTGLVYFISRARAEGRPALITGYVRTASRAVAVLALVMAIGALCFAPFVARVIAPHHAAEATTYVRVLSLFVPVAAMESLWVSVTRGFGTMRTNAWVDLVTRPTAQLLAVSLVVWTAAAAWMGLAWGLGYLLAAPLAWLAWRRLSSTLPSVARGDGRATGFWPFTLPRAFTSVVQVLMQRLDIILVGVLAGAAQAAVYAAATRFVVLGQLVTNALAQASQPRLSASLARGHRETTREIYKVSTAWTILLTWPAFLLLLVYSKPLLAVFGRGYSGGDVVLELLSLSMLVATGCGLVDVVLSMAGHTTWNLANASLALLVNVVLDLWLIPTHGVGGAALGWAVAIGLRNLAALGQVAFALRLHPLGVATTLAVAISLVSFGVLPLGARLLVGQSLLGLLVAVFTGTVTLVVATYAARRPLRLDALRLH